MSKAILILDNIDETEIAELRANVQLNLYGEDRGEYKNCSLKLIPHKDFIDEAESYQTEEEYKAYVSGYNACLEEILGGKKTMRLIDADELMKKVNSIKYLRKIKAQDLCDKCEEIDAIPIEWLKNWENEHTWEYESYFREIGKYPIECAIEDWRKEKQ